jgi:threonine dehydratase
VEVFGVQAERMAAFHASWQKGERVIIEPADSIADGLAARSPFQLPYLIMRESIADVVLLSEDEILEGIRLALTVTHNLAEGAGAASLAAAVKIKDRLEGKRVALIMSGGNLDQEHLLQALA